MIDVNEPAAAPAAGAEPAATTVDSALQELRAARDKSPSPARAAPAEAAYEPEEQDAPGGQPETTEPGAETPAGSEAEPDAAAPPAAQAPAYWTKEAKAQFAALPPEMQAVVAAQEGGRERATQKAKQEAAEARKAAETEAGAYRTHAARLGELVPQLEAAVAGKWDGVTPATWAEIAAKNPAKYTVLKAAYEADQAQLEAAKGEAAKAEADAHAEHVKALVTAMPEVDPDLAHPKEGAKRLQAVVAHLESRGIQRDQLRWVSAPMLAIAHDAMRYRQGLAALKTAARTEPKPASPAIRPSSGQGSAQPEGATAARRFGQTGTMSDALALMKAQRKKA